jgi:hypothetical protein
MLLPAFLPRSNLCMKRSRYPISPSIRNGDGNGFFPMPSSGVTSHTSNPASSRASEISLAGKLFLCSTVTQDETSDGDTEIGCSLVREFWMCETQVGQ